MVGCKLQIEIQFVGETPDQPDAGRADYFLNAAGGYVSPCRCRFFLQNMCTDPVKQWRSMGGRTSVESNIADAMSCVLLASSLTFAGRGIATIASFGCDFVLYDQCRVAKIQNACLKAARHF